MSVLTSRGGGGGGTATVNQQMHARTHIVLGTLPEPCVALAMRETRGLRVNLSPGAVDSFRDEGGAGCCPSLTGASSLLMLLLVGIMGAADFLGDALRIQMTYQIQTLTKGSYRMHFVTKEEATRSRKTMARLTCKSIKISPLRELVSFDVNDIRKQRSETGVGISRDTLDSATRCIILSSTGVGKHNTATYPFEAPRAAGGSAGNFNLVVSWRFVVSFDSVTDFAFRTTTLPPSPKGTGGTFTKIESTGEECILSQLLASSGVCGGGKLSARSDVSECVHVTR